MIILYERNTERCGRTADMCLRCLHTQKKHRISQDVVKINGELYLGFKIYQFFSKKKKKEMFLPIAAYLISSVLGKVLSST